MIPVKMEYCLFWVAVILTENQLPFLPYRKVLRQKDVDYEVSKTFFYYIGKFSEFPI